jgi:MFS family permease
MYTRQVNPCPWSDVLKDRPTIETPASSPVADGVVRETPRSVRTLSETVRSIPTFQAFQTPVFRLLWVGQGCSSVSIWMDQVARGWLLYDLTGSPLQLGLVRALQAVPLLLLSPIAGSAADRYDRKLQTIVAQMLAALVYGALGLLILSGMVEPWHVYVTAFLEGMISTFQHPARSAMTADAVPPAHLTNAIALGSVLFNVSRMTGPALAGLLIAWKGVHSAYLTMAGLQCLATLLTIPVPARLRFTSSGGRHAHSHSFVRSIAEGWSFSWNDPTVRSCLLITGSASFFIIPFTTLLPVVARDILGVGAEGQGLLLTGMGIGAFCSAVFVASVGDRFPRGILMLAGVTLYGASVAVFSRSDWFPGAMALMIVVGLFHVSSHTIVQTVVQSYTPSELRGRTMAMLQQAHVITLGGSLAFGALGTALSAPSAIAIMGGAGALAAIAIAIMVPAARRIR